MRKVLALALGAALATGVLASPSAASKKRKTRKISETVSLTLLPLPLYANYQGIDITESPACRKGQEDVTKETIPFDPPGPGKLSMSMEGFTGDWDIYLMQGDKKLSESAQDQVAGAASKEDLTHNLKKGQEVELLVCNWAGAPQAEMKYSYVYRVPAGGHAHH